MSRNGMLGLLEGAGRGISGMGETMVKASLQQAEEQRMMNLQRIKRGWDQEDKASDRSYNEEQKTGDRAYNERVALGQELRGNAREDERFAMASDQEEARYTRGRQDTVADRKYEASNRPATEGDKLIARADAALKSGQIDQATYNNITLGLSKNDKGGLTEKDLIGFRVDASKQAQKEAESDLSGKTNNPEWKAKRAGELIRDWTSQQEGLLEGGGPAVPGKQGNPWMSRLDHLSEADKAEKAGKADKPKPEPVKQKEAVADQRAGGSFAEEVNGAGGITQAPRMDNRIMGLANKANSGKGIKGMESSELQELARGLDGVNQRAPLVAAIQDELAKRDVFMRQQESLQGRATRTF